VSTDVPASCLNVVGIDGSKTELLCSTKLDVAEGFSLDNGLLEESDMASFAGRETTEQTHQNSANAVICDPCPFDSACHESLSA